ncbi:DNA-3-methyladenine glycosylase family protein [Aliiroseovarius lamellibrachiae]|uniref:DNA-3-methyladenine glycosylase family protein n=1 Tax=Aliiroseovarius lamellibrachiae TaxID=1924933 RepID=UPI001BE0147C|nr:DNA-3-methyladenine glycosylase 2 family protein [Aliiroseovarius lamellibrachiae]MBT2132564.1 DNA-3-methyladenine glycosylase 2 family protein [Aliiroseovarius lamellibrachiae]
MDERVILGPDCLREGANWLVGQDARFLQVIEAIDEIPLRLRGDGFEALFSAIIGQQVSTASAAAIWTRIEGAEMTAADRVAAASDADLAALGLSRPKIKYAHALARAGIDYPALRGMPTDEVMKILTAVSGIGEWTAEIYALFSLGRADVFPAGDLALQEAAKVLFSLPARPTSREMRVMSDAWSPWRGVAARLLWAYYRTIKKREGIR